MSGSPSDKFIGRSFEVQNGPNPEGYTSSAPLAAPAGGNSFLVAAHVRINGTDGAPGYPLVSVDDFSNPTPARGFLLGIQASTVDFSDATTVVNVLGATYGGGGAGTALAAITDITGMFGRELFIHMWYLSATQSVTVGFNGKLTTPSVMTNGGAYQAAGAPATLGHHCPSGLVSIASVGVYQVPGGVTPTDFEVNYATAQLAMASMKYGRLTLFEPDLDPTIVDPGILRGEDWNHYWTPGKAEELAPEVLPDEGSNGNALLNLDVAQEATRLIVMPGRNYASGLLLNG